MALLQRVVQVALQRKAAPEKVLERERGDKMVARQGVPSATSGGRAIQLLVASRLLYMSGVSAIVRQYASEKGIRHPKRH